MADDLLVTVPEPQFGDLWPGQEPPVRLQVWDMQTPFAGGAGGSGGSGGSPAVVVLPYMGLGSALDRLPELLPGLRLVQTLTAGFDNVLPAVPDGVTLATAAGVHDASTAELAVGLAIAGRRGLGDHARAQTRGEWFDGVRPALADSRVLLVGTGSVGGAIARRLEPFEVELTRVGTTARDDEHGHVHATSELPNLLPQHDVVVLVVPLTDATRGLVDAAFLAAMPDGALLVNVARGPVVDTPALLTEVQSGRLSAALDVTDPEPLPPDHPLWTAPNTLISPHVGGNTTAFPPRARRFLAAQLARVAAGERLASVVAGPDVVRR